MVYFLPISFTIVGLFVGSFLNMLIDRFYTGEQIIKGRSHCDLCKHALGWKDLIPLLSYITLGGKCRYCHKPIGWQNAVVEVTTAGVFGLLATTLPNSLDLRNLSLLSSLWLGYSLVITSLLIITFFSDLKFGVIYQELIIIGVVLTLLFFVANDITSIIGIKNTLAQDAFGKHLLQTNYLNNLIEKVIRERIFWVIGALGAFTFFYLLHKMFKGRAMGRGDADLAFLVALIVGFPNVLVSLFFSFLTGAFVGVILIALGKKTLKAKIPFGPFLIMGLVIGLLFGNRIIKWYIGLI